MTKKKNKLLTFCCSLIPGAGEMYMGFMKLGISIMTVFFLLIGFSSYLHLYFLSYFIPIIWFYSFFQVHNINALPDEEFYALEDHFFIYSEENMRQSFSWLSKHGRFFSLLLIFFGFSMLWDLLRSLVGNVFYHYFPERFYYLLMHTIDLLPQVIIGLALIVMGIKLLKDKKDKLKNDPLNFNQ